MLGNKDDFKSNFYYHAYLAAGFSNATVNSCVQIWPERDTEGLKIDSGRKVTSESKNAPRDPHMKFNLPTFGDIRRHPFALDHRNAPFPLKLVQNIAKKLVATS